VLTGFGGAGTSSEIRGLELCPELMPRAFPFVASATMHLMVLPPISDGSD
jgi:hypothetical protein